MKIRSTTIFSTLCVISAMFCFASTIGAETLVGADEEIYLQDAGGGWHQVDWSFLTGAPATFEIVRVEAADGELVILLVPDMGSAVMDPVVGVEGGEDEDDEDHEVDPDPTLTVPVSP